MLHYLGESTDKSSLFASSPHVLTTVSHVEEILKKVDSSKTCIGNLKKNLLYLLYQGMESSPMPQVTYTSVFGFSNSMCTHSFLGSSRIAYVDSKLQPFTTIRHNECKLPNPAANVRHTATRFMPWQNKPTKPYQLSISTAC